MYREVALNFNACINHSVLIQIVSHEGINTTRPIDYNQVTKHNINPGINLFIAFMSITEV